MMTGRHHRHTASAPTKDVKNSRSVARAYDGIVRGPRVEIHGDHLRRGRTIMPGTKPARNSPPIDTDMMPPHTIIRMLGGMITPITDGAGGDGHREAGVVALLAHGGIDERAFAGGVGGGGAGDAGEEHRDHHVDVGEAAAAVADHRLRADRRAVGDAGRVHQVGGEQEEGHGQQDEGVVRLGHLRDEQHGASGARRGGRPGCRPAPARRRRARAQTIERGERAEQDGGRESRRSCAAAAQDGAGPRAIFRRGTPPRSARRAARRRGSTAC